MCEIRSNNNDLTGLYYNNQEFKIVEFLAPYTTATIECRITGNQIVVNELQLFKDFAYNYATTIHKSQGDTFTEDYNIWEWDKTFDSHQGNALRYVAVSRTTAKANIHIIDFPHQGFPYCLKAYDKFLLASKSGK